MMRDGRAGKRSASRLLQNRNLKFTVRKAEARAVKEVELFVDIAPE